MTTGQFLIFDQCKLKSVIGLKIQGLDDFVTKLNVSNFKKCTDGDITQDNINLINLYEHKLLVLLKLFGLIKLRIDRLIYPHILISAICLEHNNAQIDIHIGYSPLDRPDNKLTIKIC